MVGDCISREAANKWICEICDGCEGTFCAPCDGNPLKDIPAADVVEVVRCKECWHHRDGSCMRWADGTLIFPDDYCSRGLRADLREADNG